MTLRNSAKALLALALVAVAASLGCAEPAVEEGRASVTSKQLAPYKAVNTPASVTADFVKALGGVPVEIDGWQGYVAGTIDGGDDDDALFAMHLSGVKGTKPVAGLSIAFVEDKDPTGDLESRLKGARTLEIRFNNGSGIVAKHDFITGKSTAPHKDDESSKALLARAFSDANSLLEAPEETVTGSDDSKSCLANYLMTLQHAARCVDANADADCDPVRQDAVNVVASCAGTETADVFASVGDSSKGSGGSVRPAAFPAIDTDGVRPAAIGAILPLFTKFFSILKPGAGGGGGIGKILGLLGSFAGKGGGGLSSITKLLGAGGGGGSPLGFLSSIFKNAAGSQIKANPLTGGVFAKLLGGVLGK